MLANPFFLVVVMCVATTLLTCTRVLLSLPNSPIADAAVGYGWVIALVFWMWLDAIRSNRLPCYDFGFMIALTYPLSVLWYCLWSRGWRGVLTLLILIGMFFGPWFVAVFLWMLLGGRGGPFG